MSDFLDCPCCGYATLSARGDFEICTICWWEDDGQDDHNADKERGGPNKSSLTAARKNFADHFDMYDAGKGIGVVANPSPERKSLIAYLLSVREGATLDERKLHGLLRSDNEARRRAHQ